LVGELYSAPHAIHKRLFSNIYSKSYIQTSSDIYTFNSRILTQRVFPKIADAAATGASIDVLRLNMAFSMDVMAAYEFGSAYGTDFLDDDAAASRFLAAFAAVKNDFFWTGHLPRLSRNLDRIGLSFVSRKAINGQAEIEDMCWKLCSRLQTALETNSFTPTSTAPVVYAQLSSSLAKGLENKKPSAPSNGGPDLLGKQVASDMLDHLIAGHETSGIALTYAMYELSRHPQFQIALRAELRSISPSLIYPPPSSGPSAFSTSPSISPSNLHRALDTLPLLNAALYETLRLYPPGAAGQPRIAPRGGAKLHGFTLPAGVVTHAAAYSVHRNEAVFKRAEEWIPERWMGEEGKNEATKWFWAFGSGSMGCIGKWFALQGKFHSILYYTTLNNPNQTKPKPNKNYTTQIIPHETNLISLTPL
jgi:hypothetical protein